MGRLREGLEAELEAARGHQGKARFQDVWQRPTAEERPRKKDGMS